MFFFILNLLLIYSFIFQLDFNIFLMLQRILPTLNSLFVKDYSMHSKGRPLIFSIWEELLAFNSRRHNIGYNRVFFREICCKVHFFSNIL